MAWNSASQWLSWLLNGPFNQRPLRLNAGSGFRCCFTQVTLPDPLHLPTCNILKTPLYSCFLFDRPLSVSPISFSSQILFLLYYHVDSISYEAFPLFLSRIWHGLKCICEPLGVLHISPCLPILSLLLFLPFPILLASAGLKSPP